MIEIPSYTPSEWGRSFHERKENEVFGAGAAGPGKALGLHTLIPTPNGLVKMKDIKAGDRVFDHCGKQQTVLACSEVMENRGCMLIQMSGEEIVSDIDHEWLTTEGAIVTTRHLTSLVRSGGGIPKSAVTRAQPAEMDAAFLPVHPYLMGVCITAGCKSDRATIPGWEFYLRRTLKLFKVRFEDRDEGFIRIISSADKINQLVSERKRRIPEAYFNTSISHRRLLLRGLYDGHVGRGPACKKGEGLIDDIHRLCSSIGVHSSHSGGAWTRIQLRFTGWARQGFYRGRYGTSNNIIKRSLGMHFRQHYFGKIEMHPSEPVKCIQVTGGIYCITKRFIPTHNSTVLLADPLEQVWVDTLRCEQSNVPDSFSPELKEKIERNPLGWGQSQGWVLHMRRTMPRLSETIQRAHRLFPQIDPGVVWSEKKSTFTFRCGLNYEFGHCKDKTDYNNYLGKSYCLAKGQRVAMADGSFKPVEQVLVGDMVATLEGAKPVVATHRVGIKPCVLASVLLPDGSFETSLFPTTHSVLLWPNEKLQLVSRSKTLLTSLPSGGLSCGWINYESLLSESSRLVGTALSTTGAGIYSSESCGLPQGAVLPDGFYAPVVLHAPSLRRVPLGSTNACHGVSCELQRQGIARDCWESCSACLHPHDVQPLSSSGSVQLYAPLPDGAPSLPPKWQMNWDAPGNTLRDTRTCSISEYAHFYTGELRAVTEETRKGWMRMEPAGEFECFDLTVHQACHYISEHNGLVHRNSYIGWDELVEFDKLQYDFITSRLRTSDPVLAGMLKIRAMSNPKLSNHKGTDISVDDPAWVKRYFVDPAPEGRKVIRRKMKRADGTFEYTTRVYLPATLYDNPDKNFVAQYEAQLLSRPKHIRDCYLYGKWDSVIGSFLDDIWNPEIHVCKPFRIPSDWPIFRSMDWGYRSNGIIGWYAMDPQGTLFKFFEAVFKEKTATWVAERIVKPFEEKNKLWSGEKGSLIMGPADTQIHEQRGESARTKYQEFCDVGVWWVNADKKSREVNAEVLVQRLRDHEYMTKTPGLVFFENCKTSIQTIPALEVDPHNPEVPKKGGWDHAWDEATYACQYAKQEDMGAPKYKPTYVESLDESEDMVEDGRGGNIGSWGYY